jgi:hypothetical protein
VDEWSEGQGEMTFSNGQRELELSWIPASDRSSLTDRSDLHISTTVLGSPATITRYAGSNDYVAIWADGPSSVEARGLATSSADFEALVGQLHQVDVNAWLSALPASAIAPADHGAVVDEMLRGLPLPPGLDLSALRTSDETRDRYQLGAQVAGAVACGWIERWVGATASGDDATARAAAAALASSHDWPVLLAMQSQGAYPQVLWQYADAVQTNGTVPGGKPGMTVAGTYKSALGCQ